MKRWLKALGIKFFRTLGPLIPGRACRSMLRRRVFPMLMDKRVVPNTYQPMRTRECRSLLLANPYVYAHHTIFWFRRFYESHTTRFLRSTLKPGGTLIDIGMNLGHFSTLGAELVGSGGRVIAFEPNPKLCELVGGHLRSQGLTWVDIRNCALGPEEGSVTLTIPGGAVGSSFVSEITNRGAGVEDERVAVPMRIGSNELASVAADDLVIKLDVEGAELEVLRGLEPVLRDQVKAAQIEISPEWLGIEKMKQMQELLTRCGFEILGACASGQPHPIRIDSIESQRDVWCVKPGRVDSFGS
ncbi:MAG: FkbM family methyltransferase [Phycisphaerales bacterium]|nr:FkbM family methyltransferase [Phycisphaerales bacterium]